MKSIADEHWLVKFKFMYKLVNKNYILLKTDDAFRLYTYEYQTNWNMQEMLIKMSKNETSQDWRRKWLFKKFFWCLKHRFVPHQSGMITRLRVQKAHIRNTMNSANHRKSSWWPTVLWHWDHTRFFFVIPIAPKSGRNSRYWICWLNKNNVY